MRKESLKYDIYIYLLTGCPNAEVRRGLLTESGLSIDCELLS